MGKASKKKNQHKSKPSSINTLTTPTVISNPYFIFTLLAILVLVAYSNVFSYPFYFDDVRNIKDNPVLRDLSNYWPPFDTNRYVGGLSFALNFHFGYLNTFGYHLVNVVIHIVNGFFIWWLVGLLFETPVIKLIESAKKYKAPIALVTALFFALHPVQTQAVTYIVQRYASLATLFYLLSIIFYIKARLSAVINKQIAFTVGAFLSAFLAMKTKEISFTIPFMIILIEWVFFCKAGDGLKSWLSKGRLISLVPLLVTVFIIPLAMLGSGAIVGTGAGVGDLLSSVDKLTAETESITRSNYLFTQFRVVAVYLKLLFLPIGQVLDYDFKISSSFFTPLVALGFLLHTTVLAASFWILHKSKTQGKVLGILGAFGVFWFYGALSVESSVIPIRDIIFEHRMYLPMLGGGLAVVCGVLYFYDRGLPGRFLGDRDLVKDTLIFSFVLSLVFTGLTYNRNIVWQNSVTLWQDVIEKSPTNPRGYNGLGFAYYNMGRNEEAVELYKKSIKIKPDYADVYNNMGIAYFKLPNSLDKSITYLEQAIELSPTHSRAINNLGVAYSRKGRFDEAKVLLLKAYSLDASYGRPFYNLGNIYIKTGDPNKAIEYYKKSIEINPEYEKPYFNMGVALGSLGQFDESIKFLNIALKIKPDYFQARHNKGAMYYKKSMYDESIAEFKTVLSGNPKYYDSMFNLAVVYNKLGDQVESKKWLDKTLALKPTHPGALRMLEDFKRQQ